MRLQAFSGEANAFGRSVSVDFDDDGTLRIFGLSMDEANRIIRALEGNGLAAIHGRHLDSKQPAQTES